jgi:acyl-CoA thioester hydrolase
MRTIGLDLDMETLIHSGYVWPVIESHCRYISSLKFGMRILVRAVLEDWEHRLRFSYLVKDKLSGRRLAKGHTVQVAVEMATGVMCLSTPPVLMERLRSHGY